jgi:hypothetical protein
MEELLDTNTINRQAAIEAVQRRPMMLSKEKVLLINDLEKLPSAQPMRGKWICTGSPDESWGMMYECSICGNHDYGGNYCSYCGAKMEDSEDEID